MMRRWTPAAFINSRDNFYYFRKSDTSHPKKPFKGYASNCAFTYHQYQTTSSKNILEKYPLKSFSTRGSSSEKGSASQPQQFMTTSITASGDAPGGRNPQSFHTLDFVKRAVHPSGSEADVPALHELPRPHIDSFDSIFEDGLLDLSVQNIDPKEIVDNVGNRISCIVSLSSSCF